MDKAHKEVHDYFSEKLRMFGSTPKGVDYNGLEAQECRFEQLTRIIDFAKPFSVIDYGCGYGAMFDFLQKKAIDFEYHGLDFIEQMVIEGRKNHATFKNAHFTTNEHELPVADYLLAGAIFNNRLSTEYEAWRDIVIETLNRMNRLCSKAFSFNMLTKYSDPEYIERRPDLFYADPLFFFDFCKRNFARNVALLHDYGLYDFTILVRKDIP